MKRLPAILACALLTAVVAGCGTTEEPERSAGISERETIASVPSVSSQEITTTPSVSATAEQTASTLPEEATITTAKKEEQPTTSRAKQTSASIAQKTTRPSTTGKTKVENALLSKAEAKKLALKRAGVAEKEISHYEIELDYDDDTRRWEYEISFHVGRMEYELTLDAGTGAVLEYEKDRD